MKIALFGRPFNNDPGASLHLLLEGLKEHPVELLVFEALVPFLPQELPGNLSWRPFGKHEELLGEADFLLSIGGDGTILDAVTFVRDSNIPILGINLGRLGFLANVAKEEIAGAVEALVKGHFSIDERTLLNLRTDPHIDLKLDFALNEVTVSRKDTTSMITVHTYINDKYLNSYWADGLIIATPTGSTGYSLSCGGPIIMPGSENFVLTPIAPHNLNMRPFVISDKYHIKLKVEGREDQFLVSLDSRIQSFNSSVSLYIEKEKFKVRLVETDAQDFTSTLRNKLLWGLDKRN